MKLKNNVAVSDSGFVFNPTTGDSYSVNPVGVYIIRLLQEGKSDDEISKSVTKEYAVDQPTIEIDLYDFKQLLSTYKLTTDV